MGWRMSVLTLILLVALAVCAVIAACNSWQLVSKTGSRAKKFCPLAKLAASVGGALIILPLVAGLHGWRLELLVAGGILCFLCYLFLTYKSSGPTTGKGKLRHL